MNPSISLIADFAIAHFSEEEHYQTGSHDPTERGFNLQGLELALGSTVDPYFRFDTSLVFTLDGAELEEAYATTFDLPVGLQLRAGQFLSRFGRQNAQHPHSWDFVDQPLALGRLFGGEAQRGLGTELSWLAPLPWRAELLTSVTNVGDEDRARTFFQAGGSEVDGAEDFLYTAAIKQFFDLSHDASLAVGVSSLLGPGVTGERLDAVIYGADVYLKYRPATRGASTYLALQAEAFHRRREILGSTISDVNGYAQVVWRFRPRFSSAARYDYGSPSKDESGAVHRLDPLDVDWVEPRHRVSQNVTFYPSEFSRLRLQGSWDITPGRDTVRAVFLNLELVAGAHIF